MGVDTESSVQKIPYPKSVFFIVSNEFCERFSYYGMKTVLTLFLKNVLKFSENNATEIYHAFGMLCYFTPVFGAMIADSFLGKFKTIFYLSVVYAIGNIVLSFSATPLAGAYPHPLWISMTGLLLIAIGTGGIKPCVSAFGGDQFVLPQQAIQLASFFSVFYFSINAGSLISTYLTPLFRTTQCFGDDCYFLAFSVPAVLMIVALVIFLLGKPVYKIKPPEGNVVARVVKCIWHAIAQRLSGNGGVKKDHWLDYAEDKFDKGLISDVKVLLQIFVLYLPLPFFWALFDQQGSRWTFQATRMNGEMFWGWFILPDQMQIINPLLILILIPIFDQGVYPFLTKMGLLKKPLQRLTVGGILAGVAFVVSGFVELHLQTTYPVQLLPEQSTLNFVNQIPCTLLVNLQLPVGGSNVLSKPVVYQDNIMFEGIASMNYKVSFKIIDEPPSAASPDFDCKNLMKKEYDIQAVSQQGMSYLLTLNNLDLQLTHTLHPDALNKSEKGESLLRFVYPRTDGNMSSIVLVGSRNYTYDLEEDADGPHGTKVKGVLPGSYDVILLPGEINQGNHHFGVGGNYLLSVVQDFPSAPESPHRLKSYIIVKPNSVHMLLLLPQYIIITVAEVMFSVTGLEFSYSQAPLSMKSVIQAAWLLTVAFGNLIVLIIAGAHLFKEQWKEFFLFAGLMFIDMLIFEVLARFYKNPQQDVEPTEEKEEMKTTGEKGTVNKGLEDDAM